MSTALLNRPSRAAALLAACLGLAASLPALAEWRDIPYAEVAKAPLTLARIDPHKVFKVRLQAQPGKGHAALPADLRLQVKVGGQVVPVPVRADGTVELPIRREWVDAGAVLQTNQPKDRVRVRMHFDSRVPAGTRMSYAQLTEAAPILEKGIKEMAGLMSFLAPEVKSFSLRFDPGPHSLVLTLPGGKKRSWKADAKGVIVLPWEPKWAPGLVELSAPLKGIDQTLK